MRIPQIAFNLLVIIAGALVVSAALPLPSQTKPKLTLDDFFNAVDYPAVEISPDGNAVVIATERPDWKQEIFRTDLWLYREDGRGAMLMQLTQSGHASEPRWSPDGRWIAFLSERKAHGAEKPDSDSESKDDPSGQLYLISPNGGEAFPVTEGDEEVHCFSWSADSKALYFATRQPWTKAQKDEYKKEWKDVVEYRTAERGDTIFSIDLAAVLARHAGTPLQEESGSEKNSHTAADAHAMATSPLRIDELLTSPDGTKLAFVSNAVNQREEKYEDVEIYTLDLTGVARTSPEQEPKGPSTANVGGANKSALPLSQLLQPRRVTHNQAIESQLRWAGDSRHVFFRVEYGDVSGPYRDYQPHLYWVDCESGAIEQWGKDFIGAVTHYAVANDGALIAGRDGTEVPMYSSMLAPESQRRLGGWPGTYEKISTAAHSPRFAFIYSSLTRPTEIYLAESAAKLDQARRITSFNKFLAERDLPQGKPYRWKTDDGTTIEGMLIYPPGSFAAKHLPLFTLIHGGPNDADGNHFEADWYQWGSLAAANGWLVFEPNYRGSTGYGDKFLLGIVPQIVSRPGKDILEGLDALVKDGIADPDRLTVGGYSYGGYMTNWLITQTTRFKAAVTSAGAVENVANWGNDDTTYDDAFFLGGRPWEAPERYQDEAAIFQIDKVRTPTHMVTGADDIRVPPLEDYLLEHALYSLGIPNKLLVLPGEGHSLAKNPWHGKIKVREELKWLQKYGGVPAQ
jgi:dipeptidyl aminopeptidase/acylaminoacyl peptidase